MTAIVSHRRTYKGRRHRKPPPSREWLKGALVSLVVYVGASSIFQFVTTNIG